MNMKLPIVVSCNNVGAIFMAKNLSSGVGTKYVNTRYHFIKEYMEDDSIKTVFVKSCDNDADLLTTNVNKDTNKKHIYGFLGKTYERLDKGI